MKNPFALDHFQIPNLSNSYFRKNIALCRILFGTLLLHHFLDIQGVTIITHAPSEIESKLFFGAALSIALIAGIATPVILMLLACRLYIFDPIIPYLGTQISVLVCWMLLLFGAGSHYSIDNLILRFVPILKRIWQILYLPCAVPLFQEPSPRDIALVRFVQILAFWGISFGAMIFHFYDESWLKLQVLQLALSTPYLSDYYTFFNTWGLASPFTYDLVLKCGFLTQGIWETFLIGLMLFRWGRFFVMWQGLAFFGSSLFLFNLGYLPVFEICWWLLMFNYPGLYRLGTYRNSASKIEKYCHAPEVIRYNENFQATDLPWISRIFLNVIVTGFITAVLAHIICNPYSPPTRKLFEVATGFSPAVIFKSKYFQNYIRAFGQGPVNVFNREDLAMGSDNITLTEIDQNQEPIRLVPFQDIHGGRLNYLRNDYLYFRISLRWQRGSRETNFVNSEPTAPSSRTLDLIKRVALLDYCLQDKQVPQRDYRVDVFFREMKDNERFTLWSPSVHQSSFIYSIKRDEISDDHLRACAKSYSMPPGHVGNDRRSKDSLAKLSEIMKKSKT